MNFRIRKHLIPGKCKVAFCRKLPRDIGTHPKSHQLCGKHYKELWRMNNPVHCAYDNLRASARKRKIEFTLTLEEFKALVEPTRYMDEKGCTRYCLHIDRIEATQGYHFDNLQVLTCTENVVKGNAERRQKFVDAKIRGCVPAEEEDETQDPF